MSKKDKVPEGQMSFFDVLGESTEKNSAENPVEKSAEKLEKTAEAPAEKPPATPLMMKVARKAPSERNIKKVFSPEEQEELLGNSEKDDREQKEQQKVLREKYRKIKRRARELEKGNQSRLILFPSITNGNSSWYKATDFSALYYAYRLADRMGRKAGVYRDSDKFYKAEYVASLVDIDKFAEQFQKLDGGVYEVTDDGIWIFNLKNPATDDEVGELRRVEQVRRDKMHNILKPKAMDPGAHDAILMAFRQVLPRLRKLDKYYGSAIGAQMAEDIVQLMAVYYTFADGVTERKDAGVILVRRINSCMATLAALAEIRVWPYDIAAAIGENLNQVKMIVLKDFHPEIKSSNKSKKA